MPLHRRCAVGKRILIVMKDGREITTRFVKNRTDRMVTEDGTFLHRDMRFMTIKRKNDEDKKEDKRT